MAERSACQGIPGGKMTDKVDYVCCHCGEEFDTVSARAYDMRCPFDDCGGMIQENPYFVRRRHA